jgi:hypothetical protein
MGRAGERPSQEPDHYGCWAVAATIMHEINNPLESISNLVYLLTMEAENLGKVRDYSRSSPSNWQG